MATDLTKTLETLQNTLPVVFLDGVEHYVVEGDRLIEKSAKDRPLRRYVVDWAQRHEQAVTPESRGLAADRVDGKFVTQVPGSTLRWCVRKSTFADPAVYERAVVAVRDAAKAWSDACNIHFRYCPELDGTDLAPGDAVDFVVRFSTGGTPGLIAAAFFPDWPLDRRYVNIFARWVDTTFDPVGVLRHELGHVLGFRHEHAREDAPHNCTGEAPGAATALTPFDGYSVMHYLCEGLGSSKLALTETDKQGARIVYPLPPEAAAPVALADAGPAAWADAGFAMADAGFAMTDVGAAPAAEDEGEDDEPIDNSEPTAQDPFASASSPEGIGMPADGASFVAPAGPTPAAKWATDAASPCYAHLGEALSTAPFTIDAGVLAALARANHFLDLGDRVLFGLRGCVLVGQQWTEFGPTLTLVEAVPDHRDRRCVIGVWDRTQGLLGAVAGSTVPNARYMFHYTQGGDNANMLPTGCYAHKVKHHHPTDPERIVHNIFRLAENIVPLRSSKDLTFTRTDLWDSPQNPFDNIHPGGRNVDGEGIAFDSAGCQTTHGSYDRANRSFHGFFAQLRQLAGLADPTPATEIGTAFRYMLLTGREARLARDPAKHASLRRLRVGSRGPAVKALQKALGLTPDAGIGVFGPNTLLALVRHQQSAEAAAGRPPSADGVVTPVLAASLGVAFDV